MPLIWLYYYHRVHPCTHWRRTDIPAGWSTTTLFTKCLFELNISKSLFSRGAFSQIQSFRFFLMFSVYFLVEVASVFFRRFFNFSFLVLILSAAQYLIFQKDCVSFKFFFLETDVRSILNYGNNVRQFCLSQNTWGTFYLDL